MNNCGNGGWCFILVLFILIAIIGCGCCGGGCGNTCCNPCGGYGGGNNWFQQEGQLWEITILQLFWSYLYYLLLLVQDAPHVAMWDVAILVARIRLLRGVH